MRKSPFPGMDPYLQSMWGDVHLRLCANISAVLQSELPEGLRAIGQQEIRLEEDIPGGPRRRTRFGPDAAVVEIADHAQRPTAEVSVATVVPVMVRQMGRVDRREWVEIVDSATGNKVITAIEILSPGNKAAGKLNREYISKLNAYIDAGVNVVEIDLLRSSRQRLLVPTLDIPPERRAAYYACVNRMTAPDTWEVYPMPLRNVLPTIPIPLRPGENDAPLSLQPILDRVYIDGGFRYTDYSAAPFPPFSQNDGIWARGLIDKHRAE